VELLGSFLKLLSIRGRTEAIWIWSDQDNLTTSLGGLYTSYDKDKQKPKKFWISRNVTKIQIQTGSVICDSENIMIENKKIWSWFCFNIKIIPGYKEVY
jgi:hypothetical protein